MRIHEAAKAVGCTQRAIKFYEEKGLLPAVSRSENGYRTYTDDDIRRLHEIQAYRKLGIGISDIKSLLAGENHALLQSILEQKRADAAAKQEEIAALEAFIARPDAAQLDEAVDYATIAQAMRAQLPGFFGRYLAAHFAPYLQIRITTKEQRDAYARVLAFWDEPQIKLPLLYRVSIFLQQLMPQANTEQMDAVIQSMLHPTEEAYERMKKQTLSAVRLRSNPLVKYSPAEIMKRQMMKRLKNCGYFDIFLPQMERLSPPYKAYRDALGVLNARLCEDLGLHYDSNFNLVFKK